MYSTSHKGVLALRGACNPSYSCSKQEKNTTRQQRHKVTLPFQDGANLDALNDVMLQTSGATGLRKWRKTSPILTLSLHSRLCIRQGNLLTLSLLMLYIYGAPCKARHFNVVYIWTYVWQRWKPPLSICCTMFQHWINAQSFPVSQLCVNTLPATKITLITEGV
jgi:hypothetical protein